MPTISVDDLIRLNPGIWLETQGWIRGVGGKKIRPKMNVLQKRMNALYVARMIAGKPVRGIVVKPRKRGASTMVTCHQYTQLQNFPHEGFIIGDRSETSGIVFDMLKFYAETDDYLPQWANPVLVSNNDEIKWANGAKVTQGTAQGKASARGRTPQFVHQTEKSHWEDAEPTEVAVNNAVPEEGFTVIWEESTPYGFDNIFATNWGKARWPTAAECPEGKLYWKQWAGVCPDQLMTGRTDLDNVRCFAAWYEFDTPGAQSFIRLTDDEKKHIQDTIDGESWYRGEADLLRQYGNDGPVGLRIGREVTVCDAWEQLAWRRSTIKNKCGSKLNSFNGEHPSDPKTCVSGEQRVGTDFGMLPIRDLKVGMTTSIGRVLGHVSMGTKAIVEVCTKRGYVLRVTPDHLVALADGEFCEAGDLAGKRVKLQRPKFSSIPYREDWIGFGGARCTIEIDERWGRFLGYFMGDGSLHNATLSIANTSLDQDVIADCEQLIRELFGEPQRRVLGKTGGWTEIRISRKEFHDLFLRLGLIKTNEVGYSPHVRKVCVPECIFRSPEPVIREFIRGLFEADGHVIEGGTAAKLYTKHKTFARDVQLLLFGLGIHSTVVFRQKRAAGKEYDGYEVIIYRTEVEKFLSEIGFISARKRSRFPKATNTGRKAKIFDDTDEVISVLPAGESDVWDIEIEGNPVFDASGVLVHNCFVSTGRAVFDTDALDRIFARTEEARPDPGQIEIIERGEERRAAVTPVAENLATVQIWERPIVGCRYILSADLAEGEDQTKGSDPDAHSSLVLRDEFVDKRTGNYARPRLVGRVAAGNRMPIVPFARLSVALSLLYGNCIHIPEMNNSGLAYITAVRLTFPWVPLWKRSEIDPITGKKIKEMDGWRTTDTAGYGGIRTQIIMHLHDALREDRLDIGCPSVHSQLANFVNKDGRMEAGLGHDDDVMALAIGYFNIGQGTIFAAPQRERFVPPELRKFLEMSDEPTGLAMKY